MRERTTKINNSQELTTLYHCSVLRYICNEIKIYQNWPCLYEYTTGGEVVLHASVAETWRNNFAVTIWTNDWMILEAMKRSLHPMAPQRAHACVGEYDRGRDWWNRHVRNQSTINERVYVTTHLCLLSKSRPRSALFLKSETKVWARRWWRSSTDTGAQVLEDEEVKVAHKYIKRCMASHDLELAGD